MTPKRPSRRKTVGLVSLILGALLVSAFLLRHSGGEIRGSTTRVLWRDLKSWGVGWKKVAYCSEQAASFRGWEARLGPLAVVYLRPTTAKPQDDQPSPQPTMPTAGAVVDPPHEP